MKYFLLLTTTCLLAACSGAETVADAAEPEAAPQDAAAEAPAKPNITSQDLGGGFYMLLGHDLYERGLWSPARAPRSGALADINIL